MVTFGEDHARMKMHAQLGKPVILALFLRVSIAMLICGCNRGTSIDLDLHSEFVVGLLNAKADSFEWQRPTSFEANFPWAWDSVYFVQDGDNRTFPKGAEEYIGDGVYGENYIHLFFTISDSIVNVVRIHEHQMPVIFLGCSAQRHGYAPNHKFHVYRSCSPPNVYLTILSSLCDSSVIRNLTCATERVPRTSPSG